MGPLSEVSIRNRMEFFNEPFQFAALYVKGKESVARVLEGPVPEWKYFGAPGTGNGAGERTYGFPRFQKASFLTKFPFGIISLSDKQVPLKVEITGWSPFIPGDADNSSLPVGTLEYRFTNPGSHPVEAVFSYHAANFMKVGDQGNEILALDHGFILSQQGSEDNPENQGAYAIFADESKAKVDYSWFKGGWFDARTLIWDTVQKGGIIENPPQSGASPGASIYVPFVVEPHQERTIRLQFCWYVPKTTIRLGNDPDKPKESPAKSTIASCTDPSKCACGVCSDPANCPDPANCKGGVCAAPAKYHSPWYAGKFKDINQVAQYWLKNYDDLRQKSALFRDTFYASTLPPEVLEAVAANLTILKSPTVQRQPDGKLWCFEGCNDNSGCCHGSCTHVWNYAQAICHLFPELERSLRNTEFTVSQDETGHQQFRSSLPIRPVKHDFHAASDGQLGGIMKVYRDWRISGDTAWLKKLWPKIKESMDFSIRTWDPKEKGVLEEPHHNTYDIEFWGPDGMCTGFYLSALTAVTKMGKEMGEDTSHYQTLIEKGKKYLETELYNGEYFYQQVKKEGLNSKFNPITQSDSGQGYKDIVQQLNEQGPKYQYGNGCITDGVLGFWMARMCGLEDPIADEQKVQTHLYSVYKYNLKHDLSTHSNPQRPSYALGNEGGLLLCTWPKGNSLSLPFVYSNEVWTGIEYQAASHMLLEGLVKEGLDIVRTCRERYDGRVRNPFNEYECGHWYARAMSSYGLIQGLTGLRYDAVDKTLYIDSKIGKNFSVFLSTQTGYGLAGLKHGKPFVDVKSGKIEVEKFAVKGQH